MKWLLLLLLVIYHQNDINIYCYGYVYDFCNNTIKNNISYYLYYRNYKSSDTLKSLYLHDLSWLSYINEVYNLNISYYYPLRYNNVNIDDDNNNHHHSYHDSDNHYYYNHHTIEYQNDNNNNNNDNNNSNNNNSKNNNNGITLTLTFSCNNSINSSDDILSSLPMKFKLNFYYKNTMVKVLTMDWPIKSHLLFPTTPPCS